MKIWASFEAAASAFSAYTAETRQDVCEEQGVVDARCGYSIFAALRARPTLRVWKRVTQKVPTTAAAGYPYLRTQACKQSLEGRHSTHAAGRTIDMVLEGG